MTALIIRDLLFLCDRWMWAKIDEFWLQTRISLFPMHHFVHTYTYNSKTKVCIMMFDLSNNCSTIRDIYFWFRADGCSTYQTTALQLEMSIFCVRARCEVQLLSYGSKHVSQSLSHKPFVGASTRNLKITGCIWTFCISNNCSTTGDNPCVV